MLTATLKNSHSENSKNHKRWYCPHHTDSVLMCCFITIKLFFHWWSITKISGLRYFTVAKPLRTNRHSVTYYLLAWVNKAYDTCQAWHHCWPALLTILKKFSLYPQNSHINKQTNIAHITCLIKAQTTQIFLTQLAIKWPFSFPPHPSFVSALPGESTTSKISLFLSNAIWLLN